MAEKTTATKESAKKAQSSAKSASKAKDIGFDVSNPPKDTCQDKNCPYHGSLKLRGRVFEGTVRSDKMPSSVVVEWDYMLPVRKYLRFMRRKSRAVAHKPSCIVSKTGDKVRIAECRPLSKTKTFVVIETIQSKK